METITLISEAKNIRIDSFLCKRFKKSRSYFQYLINEKHVLINGKPTIKKKILKEKDEIKITFAPPIEIEMIAQNISLDILYEDEHIICINKPFNMVVHPGANNFKNTFANALLYRYKKIYAKDPIRPGIVHRLDKETSGVLIAAKNKESYQKLTSMFFEKKIKKTYLCITIGELKEKIANFPIARDKKNRKKMTVRKEGKIAITNFKILLSKNGFNLIQANPITGRTHQIRVHLKYLHSPILGDKIYGNKKINKQFFIQRQMLHAYKIIFKHPISEKLMEIKAPITEDFIKTLKIFHLDQSFL